jgi:hypothetical protein
MSRFDLPSLADAQHILLTGLPNRRGDATPRSSHYPRGCEMQKLGRASDQECLRLTLAFFQIDDPRQRLGLIALAEWFAAAPRSEPSEKPYPVLQDNRKPIQRRT